MTGSTTSNINNTIKINQTWGSYASDDHNLTPANYHERFAGAAFAGRSDYGDRRIRRLDPTKVVGARIFVSGNLPPNATNIATPKIISGIFL